MSRVGKSPIQVPKGAEVQIAGALLTVKGPLGTLTHNLHPLVSLKQEDGSYVLINPSHVLQLRPTLPLR